MTSSPSLDDLRELVLHCNAHGSIIDEGKCTFEVNDDSGVGLFAKAAVVKGEVLISVPYSICISVDAVKTSVLKQIIDDNEGLLAYPDEILCIGLMHALRNPSSECGWAKHVRCLPTRFNTTLYWTDEELNELRYTNVFHLTKLMKNQIVRDWESIHKPLSEQYPLLLGATTIEDYSWALSVVYSRAVGFYRGGSYVRVIPPVVDMANHPYSPEEGQMPEDALSYDEASDHIRVIAVEDRDIGDEVHVIYGIYPNAKLAYTYGFVVLSNPHRAVDVWTKVVPETFQAERKLQALQSSLLT
jgi:SET domain